MYKVLARMADLPVYKVQPTGEDGPTRTLHRDLLLPCGDMSEAEETEPARTKVRRPRTRHSHPQLSEEHSESEDDSAIYPIQSSVIPEERFVRVCEIPRRHQMTVNRAAAENRYLPSMPANPSVSYPQDEPSVGSPPAEPVGTLPEMVETEGQEVMGEQPPTGKDITQKEMTNENEMDKSNENQPDMTNETPALADEGSDESPGDIENPVDRGKSDFTRRSERSRQPPDRFHYIQLGKPLMSFAQSLLQSFNQALDPISNYDNSPMNYITA